MISINHVILLGRVGRDPDVRHMANGDTVANFSLATSESFKNKAGEYEDSTEWHNISCFRKTAEVVAQYVMKGREVSVTGKIRTRKWQDKNGEDRYTTEIVADHIRLGKKPNGEADSASDRAECAPKTPAIADFPDDDIPF